MRVCGSCGACFEDEFDFCAFDGGSLDQLFVGPRVLSGRYLMEQRVAQGAMGMVFRAVHLQVGSTVAVKLMRPRKDELQVALARFRREAQVLGQIKHPHAVLVMDFGVEEREDQNVPFLVMEYLRGRTLEEHLQQHGALTLDQAEAILLPVMRAVEEAHQVGVVHRDIKPSNILLEQLRDGETLVKVVDFGIAKFLERAPERGSPPTPSDAGTDAPDSHDEQFLEDLLSVRRGDTARERPLRLTLIPPPPREATGDGPITDSGVMVGTPDYMAPEQITAGRILRATDVYALAILVYRVLVGRLPFSGDHLEITAAKLSDERPRLANAGVVVPGPLDEVLASAMALDPAERPSSVLALGDALAASAAAARGEGNLAMPAADVVQRTRDAANALANALQAWDEPADVVGYQGARDALVVLEDWLERVQQMLQREGAEIARRAPDVPWEDLALAWQRVQNQWGNRASHGAHSPEWAEYLAALWHRVQLASRAALEAPGPLAGGEAPGRAAAGSPGPFGDPDVNAESALAAVAERLEAKDPLDAADCLQALMDSALDSLVLYVARHLARPTALLERIADSLWRHAEVLLALEMYPTQRAPALLPLLAEMPADGAGRRYRALRQVMRNANPTQQSMEELAADPDTAAGLWRCLLLHANPQARDLAVQRASLADFWPLVTWPRTPLAVVHAIFARACVEAPPEYLKVFFLCVRPTLEGTVDIDELQEAFRLMHRFFGIPCFHEDVVFEPLLRVEQALRGRAAQLRQEPWNWQGYVESLADFTQAGAVESTGMATLQHVPLPIQRRLAREGHFLEYFVCHPNDRVAQETLRHLFRLEDVTSYLRLTAVNRTVLVELARNRRFFRQEGARLALLQNPKTPAPMARIYLPFIGHEQLRFLAANRHISFEVRKLAEEFLGRLRARQNR